MGLDDSEFLVDVEGFGLSSSSDLYNSGTNELIAVI
jgi:hypothetical protein